jgi:NAD(P)-dependent dehydrogenase (short-subunit alcohol dehydrogenase family)
MAGASPKAWFITGTSSGIGRRLTEQLLVRGDRVAATARDPRRLDDLARAYPERLRALRLDVADPEAVVAAVDGAWADLGRIDVVVSNAGYGLIGAAEEFSEAQMRRLMDTNFMGSVRLVRAALPHLRAQGGGRILQVSSVGGQVAYPSVSLYHATKWGIEGFLESMAAEVAPFGVQITLVEPGGVKTAFGASADFAEPIAAYEQGAVGEIRRRVKAGGMTAPGDPAKMAAAMIACADLDTAPLRLTLGPDAYTAIHAALTRRLVELEAQKAVAFSTDLAD